MNFKLEMIKRVTDALNLKIDSGIPKEEAIKQVKNESVAGQAVWDEVLKNF